MSDQNTSSPEDMTVVLLSPRPSVVAAARRRGFVTVVVVEPDTATDHSQADLVLRCPWRVDFDALAQSVRSARPGPRSSCFGFGEQGSLVAARLNALLGWPGNAVRVLETFQDKALLRRVVGERAGPVVRHESCERPQDLMTAILQVGLPCIVKPIAGTGSAGVHHLPDAEHAHRYTTGHRWSGPLIVEEFLHGREVSVEAFSISGTHHVLAVTEKSTTGSPHFVETGHTLPAELAPEAAESVAHLVAHTLDAVGFQHGISHTEVMLTRQGPRLIESHGRPGGDRISDMLALALGLDIFDMTMCTVFGLPTSTEPTNRRVAGIRYVTFPTGIPTPEVDIARALAIPGVHEVQIQVPAGTVPHAVARSSDRHGFVVAVRDTTEQLQSTLDTAVCVVTGQE